MAKSNIEFKKAFNEISNQGAINIKIKDNLSNYKPLINFNLW
jgi:hypothetical protein